MSAEKIQYSSEKLRNIVRQMFEATGVGTSEAKAVAESLIESNLRGHESHGILRVAEYVESLETGELTTGLGWEILTETPALLVVDGRRGFGQVLARRLVESLMDKCFAMGLACGTLKNAGHVGRLAEWVELAARGGFAALMSVNDNGVLRCVAPPGGLEARISTNPLGIAVPTGGEPLVLDLSTSVVANGKVKAKLLAGEPCPSGWLQDANGQPTTNPATRFQKPSGTLLPLGGESHGYKGFGLGLLLDVLVGGLSGGFCPPAPPDEAGTNNALMVLWDPRRFSGADHFQQEADKLIESVRSTPRKPGVDCITLPGDRSAAIRQERLANGVPLDAGTWKMLCDTAERLGVPLP